MTSSRENSIASLDLASMHGDVVATADFDDVDVIVKDTEADTVSREDLRDSFSKFDSLVGSVGGVKDSKDDDGSVDTIQKFLDHYEAAHSDITANLKAFQSDFEAKQSEKEQEQGKNKKGLGKKKRSSRKSSAERKHSVERRIDEAPATGDRSGGTAKEIGTSSPAAVQDLPDPPITSAKDDLTGMCITVDHDTDSLSGSLPEKTAELPDPSTMSAKEILRELESYSDKKPDFIEKPEMIKALIEARAKAKPTKVREGRLPTAAPAGASRTPRTSRSRGRSAEPSPRTSRTPRTSRSRGRSAEPSPHSRTLSPIRAHLKTIQDLMELDISDTQSTKKRKQKKVKQRFRSHSLNTFDIDETELESLKRGSSWWDLTGGDGEENTKIDEAVLEKLKKSTSWWNLTGGGVEESSKTSKSTKSSKNSKRKNKGFRRRSTNDLGDDDKLAKSKAIGSGETPKRRNRSLSKAKSLSVIDIDDPPQESAKSKAIRSVETPKRRNRSLSKAKSLSGIVIDIDDPPQESAKRKKKAMKKGRSISLDTFDINENELQNLKNNSSWWNISGADNEVSSKSSKESSLNSRRRKGLRKAQSSSDLYEVDGPQTDTPRSNKGRKKGLRKSFNQSMSILEVDPALGSFAKSDGNDLPTDTPRSSRRKKGMQSSMPNLALEADPPQTDTPRSSRRKKGMHSSMSNLTLDVDPPLFVSFANKSESKSSRDLLGTGAGAKTKRSSSLGRNNSNGTDSQKKKGKRSTSVGRNNSNGGNSQKKKGMRKSNSASNLDIDTLVLAKSNDIKKRSSSVGRNNSNGGNSQKKKGMRKSNSASNLDIDALVLAKSNDIKKRSSSVGRNNSNGGNSQKKKGMRKSNSASNLDIDALVLAKSNDIKKRNSSVGRKPSSARDIDALVAGKSRDAKNKRNIPMRKYRSNPTINEVYSSIDKDIPREIFAKSKANSTWDLNAGRSQYEEKQTVWYTSSGGETEEAIVLKIHLDDSLVPYYDIQLVESKKEKQTDDAHLSATRPRQQRSKSVERPKQRSKSAERPKQRSRSVDRARKGTTPQAGSSPVSVRRRLKSTKNGAIIADGKSPIVSVRKKECPPPKSPVAMRPKMSATPPAGLSRKAYRVL